MKSSLFVFGAALGSLLAGTNPAQAQLVADGATIDQTTATNISPLDLTVGTNGGNTRLNIIAPGTVNNAGGYIGFNASSGNNAVTVQNTGAGWTSSGTLVVGNSGSGNQLVVSGGARVTSSSGSLGVNNAASNNTATVTDGGSAWHSGALTVGGSGSGNQLVVSNGAAVTSMGGSLGANNTANGNSATITRAGSAWNSGDLAVGNSGSGNQLVVSSGAAVTSTSGSLGANNAANNNSAMVTGAGSVWNCADLAVGNSGSGNQLAVSSAAAVTSDNMCLGANNTANNNVLVLTGVGSVLTNNYDLDVGLSGAGNQLAVSNGAAIYTYGTGSLGVNTNANNNRAVITGATSQWNTGDFYVGSQGSGNQLVVSAGAVLSNNNDGHIGDQPGAVNNTALVTGPGSLWTIGGALYIGSGGFNSQLTVADSGTVAAKNLFQGGTASSSLTVNGGTLRVTNGLGSGAFDIRSATTLSAGLIAVDNLSLVFATGSLLFQGGTLNARQATVDNGQPFTVGNGSSATYLMSGATFGIHSFAYGLLISQNATLAGNGTVSGTLTVDSGGTLAPGSPIGTIELYSSPSLQGNVAMEISRSGATLTNDQVQVVGALIYGGSLTVSNLGPDTLALGNSFQLFTATTFSGAFSQITLPVLPAGLGWTNELLINGTIAVVGQPTVTTLPATGITATNATLNGTVNPNGAGTTAYFQYGLTTNYGSFSATNSVAATNLSQSVSNLIGSLSPGTTYHFQLVGVNSAGTMLGADQNFTSAAAAPTVTTLPAGNITATSATLNGTVNPNGAATTAYFQYGPTTKYGNIGSLASLPATNVTLALASAISSLSGPAPSNWTPRADNHGWLGVASSADGTSFVAVDGNNGQIYTSTDSGVTWTNRATNVANWYSVASSADGTKLVAVVDNGQIWTSTNSGVTWTNRDSNRQWRSVASSADGTKLVAVEYGGYIYTSADSGVTWTNRYSSQGWQSVASSADGTRLVAVIYGGNIYTSSDSGVSWAPQALSPSKYWYSVASSADGTKLVAVDFYGTGSGGQIYTSSDSGVTWTAQTNAPSAAWVSVASSADGTKLVAVVSYIASQPQGGRIYTSANAGVNWTAQDTNRIWWCVASSADGTKRVAGVDGGQLYTSSGTTSNLSPATTYHYQLVGINSAGSTNGLDLTFTTSQLVFSIMGSNSLAGGAFHLSFTNPSGLGFTVFASTNVAAPFKTWSNLGPAVESPASSGQYQFTDQQASNKATQFYRVRSP